MRATSKLLALAFTAALQPAMAGTVFLNFEDVQTVAPLISQYSASKGVTAAGAAWTATSEACGYGPNNDPGDVSFIRAGSCGALFLAQDPTKPASTAARSLTLTLADGFIDMLSFVYSANTGTPGLKVHVFDAAGRELGLGLDGLTGASCNTFVFCNWSQTVNLSFQGVARTVVFTATDQSVLLDDLRFTTPSATGQLPEPTSIALVVGALAGLGWARKRAAR